MKGAFVGKIDLYLSKCTVKQQLKCTKTLNRFTVYTIILWPICEESVLKRKLNNKCTVWKHKIDLTVCNDLSFGERQDEEAATNSNSQML